MTRSRARTTGAAYLLYFLTAIVAASLVGRIPVAYSDAANLIANAGYVAVTLLLYHITTYVEIIGIVGEGSLMLWLLVMGVNVQCWNEQAGTAER